MSHAGEKRHGVLDVVLGVVVVPIDEHVDVVGDGGIGLGPERRADPANLPEQRIPRNAPALFNIGAREFTVMFHDGRVERDATQPSGFRSPAGDALPLELDNILAVQAMFPVTSRDEMRGRKGDLDIHGKVNIIAAMADNDFDEIWKINSGVPGCTQSR